MTSFSNYSPTHEHENGTEAKIEDFEQNDRGNHNNAYEDIDDEFAGVDKIPNKKDFEQDVEKPTYNDEKDEEDQSRGNVILRSITYPLVAFKNFCYEHKKIIFVSIGILFALGITAYMIAACVFDFNRAIPLLVIWCLVVGYNIYAFIRDRYGDVLMVYITPVLNFMNKNMFWIKWVFIACVVAGLAVWIALDTSKRPNQLISGAGYLLFLFFLFLTSKYPDKVIWRPVLWGFLIQICMGMFVLRTEPGFEAFNWLGNLVQTFINYVDAGAIFLFGENFADHYFAFKVLPIIIYFSAFISILYYLGAIQWLILKVAWLMQKTLNTSATESLVAAGNIFVGQTESPLLIRPYIHDLTLSEMHAVMTAGFGTIAGSVLGAYLGYGIQPVYVITASVMAAPCALALSKLVYPETKESKFKSHDSLMLDKTDQRNLIEAAFVGASQAIPLVLNIGANLIAFISLLAAVNGFLGWFGGLLDFPELSFELICSYLFMPITYMMGIEWQDCFKVAELIGTKIFLNEFIAYETLGEMIDLRDNGTIPRVDPDTGDVNWINERSEAIVTYALCGFANVGSIGIMLGGLSSMAPKRQGEMAKIVLRALIAGIFVSILNACVAGFLYLPRPIVCDNILATTNWNYTEPSRLLECCQTALLDKSSEVACNCCNSQWTSDFTLDCLNLSCNNNTALN